MIVFMTGAGVSVASGLPTYRGLNGLYNDDIVEDGMTIMEILSVPTAISKPELVKKYWQPLRDAIKQAKPNPIHNAIAEVSMLGKEKVAVYTQNVDNLHERAETAVPVMHMHGTMTAPVLFGAQLPADVIQAWYRDCLHPDTTHIVVVGSSCLFSYVEDVIREAVVVLDKALILLDPAKNHNLADIATVHALDPDTYADYIKSLGKDIV